MSWAVLTNFQRGSDGGESLAEASCGHPMMDDNVDSDVLSMELLASQSHGDIITNTLDISNMVTEGVLGDGKPRVKPEQLYYLIAGALDPHGFEVTSEGVQLAWEGLYISHYITAARSHNLLQATKERYIQPSRLI